MNLEATFSTGAPPPPPCPCNPQRTVGRGENYPHLLSYLCFGTKATISLARCATSFVALVYTTCAYAALLRRSQPPLGYSGMCLSRPALHIKCHPRPRSGFGRSERVPSVVGGAILATFRSFSAHSVKLSKIFKTGTRSRVVVFAQPCRAITQHKVIFQGQGLLEIKDTHCPLDGTMLL